jgi:hypothetical protein
MYFQDAARAAAIVAILATGASASPQTGRRPEFVVAVLNEAAVSPNVIKSAQASLIAIFEAIGVAAVWVDTYAGDRTVLVVRIVDEESAERLKALPGSIGVALTNGNSHGWLAYVFYARIERVSDRNRLDTSAMLGAAISHELGHLLLPHGSHSDGGLMRPDWNRADLLTAGGRGLRFTEKPGALIRAALEE